MHCVHLEFVVHFKTEMKPETILLRGNYSSVFQFEGCKTLTGEEKSNE